MDQNQGPALIPATRTRPNFIAEVNFADPRTEELDYCRVKIGGDKSITILNSAGQALAKFRVDGSGKLVTSGNQPDGNQVKSSYSGAPGDTYCAYKVYPPNYTTGSGIQPYLGVDYSRGMLYITPGSEETRARQGSKGHSHQQKEAFAGDPGAPPGSCGGGGGGGGG